MSTEVNPEANGLSLKVLRPPKGSFRRRRIKGRGLGSGRGRTCGRGHKGLKARNTIRPGFEGGQMPLIQRLPKVGFTSRKNAQHEKALSITVLQGKFKTGEVLSLRAVKAKGLIGKQVRRVKIVGGRQATTSMPGFSLDPKETAIRCSASMAALLGLTKPKPKTEEKENN